jgi:hypothetical protein
MKILFLNFSCILHLPQESAVCTKHGVSGYPTIKYFMAGDKTPKDFNGGRKLDELKKFTAV